MEATVSAKPAGFPYANWGPLAAVLGVLLALGTGIVLSVPVVIDRQAAGGRGPQRRRQRAGAAGDGARLPAGAVRDRGGAGGDGAPGRCAARRAQLPPGAISGCSRRSAPTCSSRSSTRRSSAARTGGHRRRLRRGAGADPADRDRGADQRGGLLPRHALRRPARAMPRIAAALVSGLIFGGLHAITGLSAVPPLIVFGFILALLYEKTGSIVPGNHPAHAEQLRRPAGPEARVYSITSRLFVTRPYVAGTRRSPALHRRLLPAATRPSPPRRRQQDRRPARRRR